VRKPAKLWTRATGPDLLNYPHANGDLSGSFDPITKWALGLGPARGSCLTASSVAVAVNDGKKPLFTLPERMELVKLRSRRFQGGGDSFDGLLVEYVDKQGGQAIIRGLRAVSDFELSSNWR